MRGHNQDVIIAENGEGVNLRKVLTYQSWAGVKWLQKPKRKHESMCAHSSSATGPTNAARSCPTTCKAEGDRILETFARDPEG